MKLSMEKLSRKFFKKRNERILSHRARKNVRPLSKNISIPWKKCALKRKKKLKRKTVINFGRRKNEKILLSQKKSAARLPRYKIS